MNIQQLLEDLTEEEKLRLYSFLTAAFYKN